MTGTGKRERRKGTFEDLRQGEDLRNNSDDEEAARASD